MFVKYKKATPKAPVIGVFATSDPRIDKDSRIALSEYHKDGRRDDQRQGCDAG